MVHFQGLSQLRLFISFRAYLRLIFELSSELSYGLDMALFVVNSIWIESGTILCHVGDIIVWPIMASGMA